jgi:hypothetical protein
MKVSLRRKIHIMTFPQDAPLKERWSEDQSAITPLQPGWRTAWLERSGTVSIGDPT